MKINLLGLKAAVFATFIFVLALTSTAQAASITWEAPVSVSTVGDSIVDTNGSLVEALNFGELTNRTVNGVLFEGSQGVGCCVSANSDWSDFDEQFAFSDSTMYQDGVISAEFEGMMDGFLFKGVNSPPAVFTLTGLSVGSSYVLQLFVSDDRNATEAAETQFYTSGASTGPIANGLSYSLIGTFTADAATQSITVTADVGNPNSNPRVNGYQLRLPPPEVPTVSFWALGTMALLLLVGLAVTLPSRRSSQVLT